jgi:hypothetical protein
VVVAAVHTVFASGKPANRPFGIGIHRFIVSTGRKPYTWDDLEWAAAAFGENERGCDRVADQAEALDANRSVRSPGR